jgi:hypothetical protein
MSKAVKSTSKRNAGEDALFSDKAPVVRAIYKKLLASLKRQAVTFEEDAKKTSFHLTHGTAFAGVHPKKNWLDLTIRLETIGWTAHSQIGTSIAQSLAQ